MCLQLQFTKMHGCGNDYIYVDCRETGLPAQAAEWSRALSRRHFSVGADGVIYICPSTLAGGDATMRMFNADGSEGRMCGNGVRCVAEYLYTHGLAKDTLEIDTRLAGRKTLRRLGAGVWQADMGRFALDPAALPAVGLGAGPLLHADLVAAGQSWDAACLSMGNPHCVIEWPGPAPLPTGAALAELGPQFEHHPAFPEGINTEFIQVDGPRRLTMRVWERGSGETLACGTSACAAAAAMVLRGVCPRGETIEVALLGGVLGILVDADDAVHMSGPAETAFTGTVEV